jgi:hypothetical protein
MKLVDHATVDLIQDTGLVALAVAVAAARILVGCLGQK